MKKGDVITLLVIAGGGYLAYWWVTNNGPNGAVFNAQGQKVNPSYWDAWFGASAAPSAGASVSSGSSTSTNTNLPGTPVNTTIPARSQPPAATQPPARSQPPTPGSHGSPPAAAFAIPTNVHASPDINSSIKGTILINGSATTVNVIPGRVGNMSGVIYDASGQDITSNFTPDQISAISNAFSSAIGGVSGVDIPGMPMLPPSFAGGKGFGGAFGGRTGAKYKPN
jgi:hypothetical protein